MRLTALALVSACGFGVPSSSATGADADVDAEVPACFGTRCSRIAIEIDHTKVSGGPHVDFPVLVLLDEPGLAVKPVFTAADGTTKLAHDLDGQQVGAPSAWVRVPSVSSAEDTRIYAYYGDPAAADAVDRERAWNAGYVGVWHLGGQSNGTVEESTQNKNTGADIGAPMRGVAGLVGAAIAFDGVDDCIKIAASPSLLSAAASATLEMWVSWSSPVINDYQRLLMASNTFTGDGLGMEWATNAQGQHYYYPSSAGGNDYAAIVEPFSPATWYHVALTQQFTTQTVRIYVDGVEQLLSVDGIENWTELMTSADWYWGGAPTRAKFIGKMDEIRVSNVVRSSGWLATEVANQMAPHAFYRVLR